MKPYPLPDDVIIELTQPLLSTEPEPGHKPKDVLTLQEFLVLLKTEEDYFAPEQENLILMITRLRKIFYDKWGWDEFLIRKAAKIAGRFEVEIVNCPPQMDNLDRTIKKVKHYTHYNYTPKCRLVTYREDDRVYGNTQDGEIPEIYKDDHADVLLPDGYHGDMGHVLAGLDALNYPQIISPLPDVLLFLYKKFPYASSNADVATWLGDIATSAMDFMFTYLRQGNQPLDPDTEQRLININASASDMIGNIDSYVIHHLINNGTFKSKRLTGILEEYYFDDSRRHSKQRFALFANAVGLGELKGDHYTNEKGWLSKYATELRNTVAFMIYSVTDKSEDRYALPFQVWRKKYEKVIKVDQLLSIFLTALKRAPH